MAMEVGRAHETPREFQCFGIANKNNAASKYTGRCREGFCLKNAEVLSQISADEAGAELVMMAN